MPEIREAGVEKAAVSSDRRELGEHDPDIDEQRLRRSSELLCVGFTLQELFCGLPQNPIQGFAVLSYKQTGFWGFSGNPKP